MAVSILGSVSSQSSGAATSLAHTVDSGTDQLVVVVANRYFHTSIASLAWNGASMTSVVNTGTVNNSCGVSIWRLASPAVGSYNVTYTNASPVEHAIAAFNLDGVDAATPVANTQNNTGGSNTSASWTHTCSADDLTIAAVGVMDLSRAVTMANSWSGSTSVVLVTRTWNTPLEDTEFGIAYKLEANAAPNWTWGGSTLYRGWAGASFKAGAGGGGGSTVSMLGLLGVG